MPITEQQLLQILPNSGPRAGVFVGALNRGMTRFGITSPVRVAAFLAQVGHESGQLTRLVENLNYSARGLAATWPSRYLGADGQPNALAQRLARNPRAIANNAYASRNGNRDEASGDGWRYRGRGLLQITGRANYHAAGAGLGQPLEQEPELLEQPEWAAISAAWWWSTHGLNELADRGDFAAITRRINGGMNGQVERLALWEQAKRCCRDPLALGNHRAGLPGAGRPRHRRRCLDRSAALPTAVGCRERGSGCLPCLPGRVGVRSGGAGPAGCRAAPGRRAARPGCRAGY